MVEKKEKKIGGARLVGFSVQNFLSIYDTITVDFTPQPDYVKEVIDKNIGDKNAYMGVFKTGNNKVPYTMANLGIIGKNGAGKSNILKAMEFFIKFIHRVRYMEEDDYNFIVHRYKYSIRNNR